MKQSEVIEQQSPHHKLLLLVYQAIYQSSQFSIPKWQNQCHQLIPPTNKLHVEHVVSLSAYTPLGSTWVTPIETPFMISSFLKRSGRIYLPLTKMHTVSIVINSKVMELVSNMLDLNLSDYNNKDSWKWKGDRHITLHSVCLLQTHIKYTSF